MAEIEINETAPNTSSLEIVYPEDVNEVKEAGVTAALVAADRAEDPTEAYLNMTASSDINGMMDIWNKSTSQNRLEMMSSYLEYGQPEELLSQAEEYTADMSGENGILGPYRQMIKSMPSSVGLDDEAINEAALLAYHRQALSTFHPSDKLELASDIGGVLIPKRKAKSVYSVAKELGFVEDAFDALDIAIDPTDELNKMRSVALSLRGEEKAQYIKLVLDAVEKSSDNNLIKSEIMSSIFGEGTTHLDTAFEMLDIAAVAELGIVTTKVGTSLAKGASILNTARKMNSPETAATIILHSLKNPGAAKKLGVTQADTGDAVNPLINGEIADLLEGVPEDMSASIAHMLDMQDARFRVITDLTTREGVIDSERMAEVMRAAEIEQMKQPGVIEAKIIDKDETGFVLQYKTSYSDELGNTTHTTETKTVNFQLNQTGSIESPIEEYSTAFNKLDPNARMSGRLRNWFVSTVEELARSQSKTAINFDRMMQDAYKGLKKKDAIKVDYALKQGAKEAIDYNYNDLVNIGVGPNKVKLTPKEAKAYIGVRNVVNHMYSLKNKQIVDNFLALDVKLVDDFDGVIPARTYDDVDIALDNWKNVTSDSHWINVAGSDLAISGAPIRVLKLNKKSELSREMLEEAYSKGYVLAKNHSQSTFFKQGDIRTQWSFIKKENVISPRGQQVINKIPGYIPKQRTNGYYFIKSSRSGVLSGASKNYKTQETVAWADSLKAADDWIAAQDDPSKFTRIFDRELPADQRLYEVSATHGGMYSGSRKSTELPYVGDARAEFADSFEAMQHYINHIGRQYPASLYRLGSEQRLLSVAKSLNVKGATGLHDVLEKAIISGFNESTKEYKLLKDIHDQVSFVNMIPTADELRFAKKMESLGNALEQPILNKIPGWSNVPKFFYNRASAKTHPADLIRGLTFNHLLGLYNPAQLLVQFSGAMVSFSVSPIKTIKSLPKALVGWPMLDLIHSDPKAQMRVLKWMRESGLKDYADDYELWTRSGYRESVIGGNADYTSVFMKNLPYDAGIVRKAFANHTVFYKMGELANTRTAFAVAIERYKDLKKVDRIDPNDAKALEVISKDAEILRLNMSKANQADINKGWKSVPLQFQQVITKYFEKVLPKGFGGTDELTGPEKLRLATVPTMVTGAAGIPLGQPLYIEILKLYGEDPTTLNPEQTQSIKYGVLGLGLQYMDFNIDLSTRMTLGADVIEKAIGVFTEGRSLWEWLGPTSTIADRYFRNFQFLGEAFDLSVWENDEVNMESLKFMASVLKEAALDIPTLSRNYKQYAGYFFTQNPQFIKDGKYLFDFETMNERTALFAIAGFQPQELSEIYELDKELNDGRAAYTLFGDTDADVIRRILNVHVLNESATVYHQKLGAQMINVILKKYGPMEASDIMQKVWQKSVSKQYDQNEMLFKTLMELERRMGDGLGTLNTMFSRKRQQFEGQ